MRRAASRLVGMTGAVLVSGLALEMPPAALAQWIPNGVALCDSCYPGQAEIGPDGAGGVFGAWEDGSLPTTRAFGQHLTAAGAIASGWPAHGLQIGSSLYSQYVGEVIPDGHGGMFVNLGSQVGPVNTYVLNVSGDGTVAPGWTVQGSAVQPSSYDEIGYTICRDGSDGVFAFYDIEYAILNADARVQDFTATGTIRPGWPDSGVALRSVTGYAPVAAPDDSGGAIIVWQDIRNDADYSPWPGNIDLFAARIRGNGSLASGWPATGLPVCTAPNGHILYGHQPVVPDDAGGIYAAWVDFRNAPPHVPYGGIVTVTHLRPDGTLAPGWPADGLEISDANDPYTDDVAADGAGGVFVVWESGGYGMHVQHVLANGTLAPGWAQYGVSPTSSRDYTYDARLCSDGSGGVYVAFFDQDKGAVYLQHLGANGLVTSGWPATGVLPSLVSGMQYPRLCSDGAGGVIVAWSDGRSGRYSERAQHYPGPGSPTAVDVSLISARALADRIELAWVLAQGAGAIVTLEREAGADGWSMLANLSPDGTGKVTFEDRAVVPGVRYGYRLSWTASGAPHLGGETWIQMPSAVLSLSGLRPNPGMSSNLQVAYSLPDGSPATLELIDVAGRRVASREVGGLGAGAHVVPLESSVPVAAGLYWLRLRQGSQSLVAKSVVAK